MSSSPTDRPGPPRTALPTGSAEGCGREVVDAPDGGLGRRGDDRRVAQAARRLGRGRRDDLRRDHRQGRRRDPLAGQRPAGSASWSSPATTVAVGDADRRDRRAARPGEAHPAERNGPSGAGGRSCRPRSSTGIATANGEADRSRFYSPVVRRIADKHGVDLSPGRGNRDRRPGAQEGRARPRRGRRERPEAARAPAAHRVPLPARPGARRRPRPTRRAARREGGRARADDAHAPGDRQHMVGEPPHGGALHDDRRGRHLAGRRAARRAPRADGARAASTSPTSPSSPGRRSRRSSTTRCSTPRSRATRSSTTTTSTSGSRWPWRTGLIVPVIRQAQRLSLEGLAAAIADLAERARSKRLEPDEVHGGTFTITNPGQFGAVLATPIINQPQVAILDLEAIVKRPVVVDDERRRRFDRDPADDLPVHVVGPPGARRRRRRRGSSRRSRSGWRDGR